MNFLVLSSLLPMYSCSSLLVWYKVPLLVWTVAVQKLLLV